MWILLIVGVLLSYPSPRVLGLSALPDKFNTQAECEQARTSESFAKSKEELGLAIQKKFNAEFWASDKCVNVGMPVQDSDQ